MPPLFFLLFSFKLALSLSTFTLIKRFFSSSLLPAIRVLSSAYLRCLIFLLPVLIPACNSSSLAYLMMCSAYRLKKWGVCCHPICGILWYSFFNLEPISCSIQGSSCCFLAHIQVSQETGKMFWYSHLFKSVSQFVMFHTVRGFSLVSETEEDIFVEFPCFLYDLANVGNLISASSSFSKPSLDTWKFLVCIILKPSMQDFFFFLIIIFFYCSGFCHTLK